MIRQTRRIVFFIAALLLAGVFFAGYGQLAPLGQSQSVYGDAVNIASVETRHITDAVTAVNFDIRGFDTLGEEFILFASVMGVVLLMRRAKDDPSGDHEDYGGDRKITPTSDAVRVTALLLIAPTVLFGYYMVTHGQLTPGGGFQGGVILATAPLLVYLAGSYPQFRKLAAPRFIEIVEAIGAAIYILVGGACLIAGGQFLQNFLPIGKLGSVTSGGIVGLIDLGVGLEVGGGFVLIMLAYLEELMESKE